jgi:hypothetical protein
MSDLVPALLPLDKGLNLQTAKLIAPPGSVLDSLNYEQVDFQGQKRIDGYARYDGTLLSAQDVYYVVTSAAPWAATEGMCATEDGMVGWFFRDAAVTTTGYILIINQNRLPVADDVLLLKSTTIAADTTLGTVATIALGSEVDDEETHYERLLELNATLRAEVEELPGAVIGLHWFRDRLYAVADVLTVSLNGTTPEIFPNDTLRVSTDLTLTDYTVLEALTLDNTRVLFLSGTGDDVSVWSTAGDTVTRSAVSVGAISDGFETFTSGEETASFFESRTEEQVFEEDTPGPYDFGWRFVHQGWSVPFENGTSLFGEFPALNQNIQGLGVQGPTSTSGNNGRPLVLIQKVNITTGQAQVSGWKSTDTPTSYILDPDNLTDIDTDYIYADAFISWDEPTGAVSAPGITTSTLPEYSASATVEVEI